MIMPCYRNKQFDYFFVKRNEKDPTYVKALNIDRKVLTGLKAEPLDAIEEKQSDSFGTISDDARP